jgi:hypothetical protein
MGLLRSDRDKLINHLYPKIAGMPEAYCFHSGRVVALTAKRGGRDVQYMLARKVVEHLHKSLLSPTPTRSMPPFRKAPPFGNERGSFVLTTNIFIFIIQGYGE